MDLFSGNRDIASRIVNGGKAHIGLFGDSIQNQGTDGMVWAYHMEWNVPKVVGICHSNQATSSAGTFVFTFTPTGVASNAFRRPDGAAGPHSLSAYSPTGTYNAVLNSTAFASGTIDQRRTHSFSLSNTSPTIYKNGDPWANKALTARLIYVANASGVPSGTPLQLVAERDGTTYYNQSDFFTEDATTQIKYLDIPIGARPDEDNTSVKISGIAGTSYGDKNIVMSGVRWFTGETGLQFAHCSYSGWTPALHTDEAKYTDDALSQWATATDTNISLIWLGANNDPSFLANMTALVDRHLAISADHLVLIVTQFDTTSSSASVAQGAADMLALASDGAYRDRVMCANLHAVAGSAGSNIALGYLNADGIHPNAGSGYRHYARRLWGVLRQADSVSPSHMIMPSSWPPSRPASFGPTFPPAG